MSNTEVSRTDPATITKHRVEAVEYEVALCPNCEQDYDPEHMVPAAVGLDADHESAGVVTSLCPGCADSVFGFEAEDEVTAENLFDELSERSATSITGRAIMFAIASALTMAFVWLVAEAMTGMFELAFKFALDESTQFGTVHTLGFAVALAPLPVMAWREEVDDARQ